MKTTVKLEGFKELDQALSKLPEATGRRTLRTIAKGALEPMADDAASRAPRDEGLLAFSITVSERRTRRAKTGYSKRQGVQMAMGPASGVGTLSYASFVEFGTVDTAAQPYMRPAWDAGAERTLQYVKDNLNTAIEKAASRLAKRQAKKLAKAKG